MLQELTKITTRRNSLRNILAILFKRKKLIISVFLSVVLPATIMTLLMPRIYEASSVVVIEKEADAQRALLFRMNVRKNEDQFDWIRSEIEIIKSFPVASRVVKELPTEDGDIVAMMTGEAFSEQVENFQRNLDVKNPRESNILKITYQSKNPVETALVIDKVIETYKKYRAEIFNESITYSFFEEQLRITDEKLRDREKLLTEYKRREEIISPEKQGSILLSKLAGYEKSLTSVHSKRIGKEAKLEVMKNQLTKGSGIYIPSTEVTEDRTRAAYLSDLKRELLDKQIQRERLLQLFKPIYQEVVNLEQEIATIEKQIKTEVQQIINQADTAIRALKAEENTLQQSIDKLNREIKKFAQKEMEFSQLSRGIDDRREIYSMLLKQREEARISLAKMQRGIKIKVINPARVPIEPVSPKRKLNILMAIVLGLIGGVGLAFVLESFDQSVNSPEEIKKITGLKLLGTVKNYKREPIPESSHRMI